MTFGDRGEFLGAVPNSEHTYSPGLNWFEKHLRTLDRNKATKTIAPAYNVENPLAVFLERVDDDQNLPKKQRCLEDRKILASFVTFLKKNGKKPKTIRTYINAVQSFGSYYDVTLTTKFIGLPKPHVLTKSHPWQRPELEKFIELLAVPSYQSMCSTFAQSGLSIIDTIDLHYIDIKEEFEAGICPIVLDFTKNSKWRHKTEVEFRTFIGSETIELLKRHFKINPPEDNQPIFPVTDRAVQDYFARRAQKMLGAWPHRNPMSPHSVRKYYRKKMVNNGCPSEYVEYMMGHDVDTDLRITYTAMTNDEWRDEYKKFCGGLSFTLPKINVEVVEQD